MAEPTTITVQAHAKVAGLRPGQIGVVQPTLAVRNLLRRGLLEELAPVDQPDAESAQEAASAAADPGGPPAAPDPVEAQDALPGAQPGDLEVPPVEQPEDTPKAAADKAKRRQS